MCMCIYMCVFQYLHVYILQCICAYEGYMRSSLFFLTGIHSMQG